MKLLYPSSNLILLFSICLYVSLPNSVVAQGEYQPLLDESAIWNFEHITECEPYTPYYGFRYSLTLDGDTSINNTVYQKLYRPAWEFFMIDGFDGTIEDCDDWNFPEIGYIGALREDIAERKVYYLAANEEEELLLYDFTLEVGDTLNFYFPEYVFWENENAVIDIVDSVLINGDYHRRWIIEEIDGIEGTGDVVFIEGIGGMHGLIEPDAFFMLHHPITELNCYTNDAGDLYPIDSGECALITDVHEIEQMPEVSIFPNPARESFSLMLPGNWVHRSTVVQVSDITGRLIWEKYAPATSKIEINTSRWGKGLYLVSVRNHNSQQSRRLIVD